MATIVVVGEIAAGGGRTKNDIEVQEDVATVTAQVNVALKEKLRFVALTGADGKELTVEARKVQDIWSA